MRIEKADASLTGKRVCGKWLRFVAILPLVCFQFAIFANVQESTTARQAQGVCIGIRPNGVVQVKGVLRTEAEARKVLMAIRSVRPDLRVSVEKLTIDPNALAVPVLNQVPDFIEELSLTTHEWDLCVKPNEFLVSGQTDSLVTHATFEAMLNIVRFENDSLKTRNLICLVSADDFPEVQLNLPDALTQHEEFFKKMPLADRMAKSLVAAYSRPEEISFVTDTTTPTIGFSQLPSLELVGLETGPTNSADAGLLVSDRLDWLFLDADRVQHTPPPLVAQIIAMPISTPDESKDALQESTPIAVAKPAGATPAETTRPPLSQRFQMSAKPVRKRNLKVLGRVPFSGQSFMLQTTQMTAVDDLAKELLSNLRLNDDVILCGRVGGSGADAFNEWITNKRVEEVKRSLLSSGIAKERISVELKAAHASDEFLNAVEVHVPIQTEATVSIFRQPTSDGEEAPETSEVVINSEMTAPTPSTQSSEPVSASIFKTPRNLPTIDGPISTPIAAPIPETGPVLRVE